MAIEQKLEVFQINLAKFRFGVQNLRRYGQVGVAGAAEGGGACALGACRGSVARARVILVWRVWHSAALVQCTPTSAPAAATLAERAAARGKESERSQLPKRQPHSLCSLSGSRSPNACFLRKIPRVAGQQQLGVEWWDGCHGIRPTLWNSQSECVQDDERVRKRPPHPFRSGPERALPIATAHSAGESFLLAIFLI